MQVFTFAPHTASVLAAAHRSLTCDCITVSHVISLLNSRKREKLEFVYRKEGLQTYRGVDAPTKLTQELRHLHLQGMLKEFTSKRTSVASLRPSIIIQDGDLGPVAKLGLGIKLKYG